MCVCLHTRHISISPRIQIQCETLQFGWAHVLILPLINGNGRRFFLLCCRYGCLSFYLTTSLSSLK